MNSDQKITTDEPLFREKYWKRPDLDPTQRGEASPNAIYCAVGYCLSMWECAENALADVFLMMSGCEASGSYVASRRAFGAIESSGGRREMLDEVAPVYFGAYWTDKSICGPYKKLIRAFSYASHRRDDVAHGIVTTIRIDNEDMGTFLVPAAYNSARNKLSPSNVPGDPLASMPGVFRYTATHINCFANGFLELRNKTLEYLIGIRKIGGIPRQILIAQGIDPTAYEASLAGR